MILVGYGVALHSVLYPASKLNWSLIERMFSVAYFQIYGELFIDTILDASANQTDPTITVPGFRNYFGLFLTGIFLLFVNILLLNLLIALFNSSYCRVEADSAFHNVINQIEFLREFQKKSVLPPPFVLIDYLIIRPICAIKQKCKKRTETANDEDEKKNGNNGNDGIQNNARYKGIY